MNKTPTIWVLLDDKIGHQNQALGVAEALGRPFERKHLHYNFWVKLPNFLKFWWFGLLFLGVSRKKSSPLVGPWPDIIIACGRKTAPIAHWICKKSKGQSKLVHIMWPGYSVESFSLIALPEHDRKHGAQGLETTFPTMGAPHRLSPEMLQSAHTQWAENFRNHSPHAISVFVGGDSSKISWQNTHMQQFIGYLRKVIHDFSGTIYVTTSRRTPPDIIKALRVLNELHEHVFLFIWGESTHNPYQAMLARADGFLITGDSINMVTESCFRGRPVCAHMPWDLLPKKHQRFLQAMVEEKYIMPLSDDTLQPWLQLVQQQRTVPALPNPAIVIAEEIEESIIAERPQRRLRHF